MHPYLLRIKIEDSTSTLIKTVMCHFKNIALYNLQNVELDADI